MVWANIGFIRNFNIEPIRRNCLYPMVLPVKWLFKPEPNAIFNRWIQSIEHKQGMGHNVIALYEWMKLNWIWTHKTQYISLHYHLSMLYLSISAGIIKNDIDESIDVRAHIAQVRFRTMATFQSQCVSIKDRTQTERANIDKRWSFWFWPLPL